MKRLLSQRLPLWQAVLLLALLSLAASAAVSLASNRWKAGSDWYHSHAATKPVMNSVDNPTLRSLTFDARNSWDYWTRVALPGTTDHSITHIQINDGWYGDTAHTGETWPISCGSTVYSWGSTPMHCPHFHIKLNMSKLAGSSTSWQRAVACHEIGHALGIDHQSSGSCMATDYWNQWTIYGGTHNYDMLNYFYGGGGTH